jgi:hypothetical protein
VSTPDLAARAHHLLTTTERPLAEIAAELGLSVEALEKRLERRYDARSREIRTGQPAAVGRPPQGRSTWWVRLTVEERAGVEAAILRERKAGAETDGAALAQAVRRQ